MEVNTREINSIRRELDFTLSSQDLQPYLNKVYAQAQKNIALKGFRKGKTPINLIKKLYGESLESEGVEEAVNDSFGEYTRNEGINPIGSPMITKLERTPEGGAAFSIVYETMPEFELHEYKGLPARRIYHVVTDEEITEELDRLAERYMSSEPAEAVDDENHIVGVDLQKIDDAGEAVEGDVSRDLKIYLKRPNVNQELKASLLNTRVGDTFRIDLPTGENESMTHYEVTIKDISRAVTPEHTDELAAKAIGDPTATFEDLREMVRANIEATYEGRYSRYFRDELINALLENYTFDVPEVLVGQAMNSFVEDVKQGPKKELPKDFDRAKFDEEMRPMAEQTVRWALIRDRIIESEELKAEEPDYEGLADMEAQRTGIDYDTLLKYFKNAPEVKDKILSEKAIQFLEDYAVVQEVEDLEVAAEQAANQESADAETANAEPADEQKG